MNERLLFGRRVLGELGWVFKAAVDYTTLPEPHRAAFVCVIADGDNVVERHVALVVDVR